MREVCSVKPATNKTRRGCHVHETGKAARVRRATMGMRTVVAALARCGAGCRCGADAAIADRTSRPLPADQPAAAQDTRTGAQRSDQSVARHDAADRRAAAADLSFAGG